MITVGFMDCIIITIPILNAMIEYTIQFLLLLLRHRPYSSTDEFTAIIKSYMDFCLKHFGYNA